MYIIYQCDCGKPQYTNEYNKTRKCPYCNHVVTVKKQRTIAKTRTREEATLYLQQLQDEIYHNTGFLTADKL